MSEPTISTVLVEELGFTHQPETAAAMQEWGDALKMSDSGPYTVHDVWVKDNVFIQVESTNAPLDMGGLQAQVQYPHVAIIENTDTHARVACSPSDLDAVRELAVAMA